ncbi:MAG TPA: 16S rRNA (guanine(527)-N(7))-methyltransferase RsmG [Acetobacteraceae bacterium]
MSRFAEALLPPPGLPAVSRETLDRLHTYAALLEKWTAAINLIGSADRGDIWSRHIGDCLRLLPLIPSGTSHGIDLGSGAGLPGLVLAIASGIPFDLVESDRRKAAFLQEAARVTGAPVHIHATRIETVELPPAPLVTARALAPLNALLALAAPLLAPDGIALFPKGARAAEEVEQARQTWCMNVVQHTSPGQPGAILSITGLHPVRTALGAAHA